MIYTPFYTPPLIKLIYCYYLAEGQLVVYYRLSESKEILIGCQFYKVYVLGKNLAAPNVSYWC